MQIKDYITLKAAGELLERIQKKNIGGPLCAATVLRANYRKAFAAIQRPVDGDAPVTQEAYTALSSLEQIKRQRFHSEAHEDLISQAAIIAHECMEGINKHVRGFSNHFVAKASPPVPRNVGDEHISTVSILAPVTTASSSSQRYQSGITTERKIFSIQFWSHYKPGADGNGTAKIGFFVRDEYYNSDTPGVAPANLLVHFTPLRGGGLSDGVTIGSDNRVKIAALGESRDEIEQQIRALFLEHLGKQNRSAVAAYKETLAPTARKNRSTLTTEFEPT